jgi:hypothetical protein
MRRSRLTPVWRGVWCALTMALALGAVGYLRDWNRESWMLGGLVGVMVLSGFIVSDVRRFRRIKLLDE